MASDQLLLSIPAVEPDELAYLQQLTRNLNEDKLRNIIVIYNGRRKKSETILICCLLGFVCCAGVQRFITGQLGMGILYLFTGGLCLIGTIVDTINYRQMAFEFNRGEADEVMGMIGGF